MVIGREKSSLRLFLLFIFLFLYTGANLYWVWWDTLPPPFDQSAHALNILKYHQLFDHPSTISGTKLLKATNYWPPFFYVCAALMTQLFGFEPDIIILTNFVFLLFLVWALYKLAGAFFPPAAGLVTVMITLLSPIVFALLRDGLIDFSLLTLVTLVQYLIIKSEGGLKLGWGVVLGVTIGLTILTKWTGPAFFALSGLLIFFLTWRKQKKSIVRALFYGLVVVLVALVIAVPWYVKNYQEFLGGAKHALLTDARLEGDPVRFWPSLLWYLIVLKDVIISSWLMPFFLVGLAAFFIWVKNWAALAFSLSWFLPGLLIFILIPNKDARFILPLLPSLVLLSAAGICFLPRKFLRLAIILLIFLAGTYQFLAISFAWPKHLEHPYTHPALRQDWPVEAILASLAEAFPGQELRLAILANEPYFNPNVFHLLAAEKALPYKVDGVGDRPLNFIQLSYYHFLLLKSGEIALPHTARYREEFLSRFWKWIKEEGKQPRFSLWGEWPLPDGSKALVYKIN